MLLRLKICVEMEFESFIILCCLQLTISTARCVVEYHKLSTLSVYTVIRLGLLIKHM